MDAPPFRGLIAAPHTPFADDGSLALERVAGQARYLSARRVRAVFVAGSTGEGASLSVAERRILAEAWVSAGAEVSLRVIVHVGHDSLAEARGLATHAAELGVAAIGAVPPTYFKPATVEQLVGCCREIAAAAPETPFYYYDIPALSGVALPMPAFLRAACERIPTFTGIKYTNPNLADLQTCVADGRADILFGCDEALLAGLVLGVRGAVGSTYNFAAPLYHALIASFEDGDLEKARALQRLSVRYVDILASFGYMGAAKALMRGLGVDCGPPRAPLPALEPGAVERLMKELGDAGFFEWVD